MRVPLWAAGVAFATFAQPSIASACTGTVGTASFYGTESCQKHRPCRTATGAYFDGSGLTAAMPSRSMLGKRVRVTYQGRSVVVLVNDLGPAARLHRVIDLSRAAARRLGMGGVGRVCIEPA